MTSKIELINKLQGPENRNVLHAVEELRSCGKLTDGSLRGIALCQAQLLGADLSDADLAFVDFHQANLDNTDLANAKLQGVKFNRASMQGANLEQADLTNADLYKVNLRGARNLTTEQLSKVDQLFGSIMPDGSVYDGCLNLFGDLARARWAKVKIDDPKSMAEFYGVSLDAYMQGQTKDTMVLTSM
jgi:2-iminobutanoate/2-iminopropanoate deaminase